MPYTMKKPLSERPPKRKQYENSYGGGYLNKKTTQKAVWLELYGTPTPKQEDK